jgi:hypothetical protein
MIIKQKLHDKQTQKYYHVGGGNKKKGTDKAKKAKKLIMHEVPSEGEKTTYHASEYNPLSKSLRGLSLQQQASIVGRWGSEHHKARMANELSRPKGYKKVLGRATQAVFAVPLLISAKVKQVKKKAILSSSIKQANSNKTLLTYQKQGLDETLENKLRDLQTKKQAAKIEQNTSPTGQISEATQKEVSDAENALKEATQKSAAANERIKQINLRKQLLEIAQKKMTYRKVLSTELNNVYRDPLSVVGKSLSFARTVGRGVLGGIGGIAPAIYYGVKDKNFTTGLGKGFSKGFSFVDKGSKVLANTVGNPMGTLRFIGDHLKYGKTFKRMGLWARQREPWQTLKNLLPASKHRVAERLGTNQKYINKLSHEMNVYTNKLDLLKIELANLEMNPNKSSDDKKRIDDLQKHINHNQSYVNTIANALKSRKGKIKSQLENLKKLEEQRTKALDDAATNIDNEKTAIQLSLEILKTRPELGNNSNIKEKIEGLKNFFNNFNQENYNYNTTIFTSGLSDDIIKQEIAKVEKRGINSISQEEVDNYKTVYNRTQLQVFKEEFIKNRDLFIDIKNALGEKNFDSYKDAYDNLMKFDKAMNDRDAIDILQIVVEKQEESINESIKQKEDRLDVTRLNEEIFTNNKGKPLKLSNKAQRSLGNVSRRVYRNIEQELETIKELKDKIEKLKTSKAKLKEKQGTVLTRLKTTTGIESQTPYFTKIQNSKLVESLIIEDPYIGEMVLDSLEKDEKQKQGLPVTPRDFFDEYQKLKGDKLLTQHNQLQKQIEEIKKLQEQKLLFAQRQNYMQTGNLQMVVSRGHGNPWGNPGFLRSEKLVHPKAKFGP